MPFTFDGAAANVKLRTSTKTSFVDMPKSQKFRTAQHSPLVKEIGARSLDGYLSSRRSDPSSRYSSRPVEFASEQCASESSEPYDSAIKKRSSATASTIRSRVARELVPASVADSMTLLQSLDDCESMFYEISSVDLTDQARRDAFQEYETR